MRRYNLLQPIKQKGGTARSFKRVLGAALAVLMMVGLMVPSALATSYESAPPTSSPTPTGDCSLTVNFKPKDIPTADVEFQLYKVADVDPEKAKMDPDEKYAHILRDENSTWADKAEELKNFMAVNKVEPDVTGKTNEKGQVTFSGLQQGVYLLMSTADDKFIPVPALLTLPAYVKGVGWTQRNLEVNAKFELRRLAVEVIWKDNNYSGRPSTVTVELFHESDGTVIHTVPITLTPDSTGRWYYEWDDPWGDLKARIKSDSRTVLISSNYHEEDFDKYTMKEEGITRTYTLTLTRGEIDITDPETPTTNFKSVRVLKVWRDGNDAAGVRPSSVTVDLVGSDGTVKTAELSAGNSWRYTWTGLDQNVDWSVVERGVDNYTVSTSTEGITQTITNTYSEDIGEEDPPLIDLPEDPDVPLDPGPQDPQEPVEPVEPPIDAGDPDIPLDPGFPDNPVYPGDPDIPLVPASPDPGTDVPDEDVPLEMLPQTGLLWWPVPILAILGAALIVMGYARRRRA